MFDINLSSRRALILFIHTLALYKSFTYLLTYLVDSGHVIIRSSSKRFIVSEPEGVEI